MVALDSCLVLGLLSHEPAQPSGDEHPRGSESEQSTRATEDRREDPVRVGVAVLLLGLQRRAVEKAERLGRLPAGLGLAMHPPRHGRGAHVEELTETVRRARLAAALQHAADDIDLGGRGWLCSSVCSYQRVTRNRLIASSGLAFEMVKNFNLTW